MESEDQDSEYSVENMYRQEFELLKGMFQDHFCSDVISGVLEDCGGDVNLAVDTLTNIEGITDLPVGNATEEECNTKEVTECPNNHMPKTNVDMSLQGYSYAAASQISVTATAGKGKGQSVMRKPPRPKNVMPKIDYWTDQIRKIISDFNEGSRIMILMRGLPGSGKTYLARVLVESTVGTVNSNIYKNHIYSSDDLMTANGKYQYNINRLSDVHSKNQSRVKKAVREGRSPVIVDNTNLMKWEMLPYLQIAVKNGYIVEVVEPINPWARIPSQLAKRTIHGVPKDKIQLMLNKFEGSITGESLIKHFQLRYPEDMVMPLKRNLPAINKQELLVPLTKEKLESLTNTVVNQIPDKNSVLPISQQVVGELQNDVSNINETPDDKQKLLVSLSEEKLESLTNTVLNKTPDKHSVLPISQQVVEEIQNDVSNINEIPDKLNVNGTSNIQETNNEIKQQQSMATHSIVDEMLKVEVEWDNGDGWETPLINPEPRLDAVASLNPKPQRSKVNEVSNEYILPSMLHDDWTKNLTFETSLLDDTASSQSVIRSKATHVEKELSNDKHTPTIGASNDVNDMPKHVNGRCVHEEKHFVQLRKMFKNIQRAVLRDIFDNCDGDVDWACSIVLDGIQQNILQVVDTEESNSEDENDVDCQCQCDQPRDNISDETISPVTGENESPIPSMLLKKKTKKEKNLTGNTFLLKRQIEHTVIISDHHYSQHYLNLRRYRSDNRSNNDENGCTSNENQCSNMPQITDSNKPKSSTSFPESSSEVRAFSDTAQYNIDEPSTSGSDFGAEPSISGAATYNEDEEFECDSTVSDDDRSVLCDNVTVNIGMEFVRKLDELNNRHDFEYPEGVNPILNIPLRILNELNAIWVESITYQLDKVYSQTEEMIKQDEDFARQIELEIQLEAEEEGSQNAQEKPDNRETQPCEPNLKDIMDTEIALAIYEKDIKEEWKNKEPQDMAAQMTRKKLFMLFPDVGQETLSEMLIAHKNCFDNTVETLLISTGQAHYLDQTNGIKKFVMEKEKENREKKNLEAKKLALTEEEYPYLMKPGEEQTEIDIDMVIQMRNKATTHRETRDKLYKKAMWYHKHKKLTEASYYSGLAAEYTSKYENASNYAAAALVQYHAKFHPGANVIDLHFLRVPEAESSLDLFLDDRLRKLRLSLQPRMLVVHIITGRGKHSNGKPRVKPAIMKRLVFRGLQFRQQNPGLLETRLRPTNLLLEEILNS